MFTLLLTIHIIVSLLLVVIILMQQSKGGVAAMFGGGQDSVFGASGADSLFSKITAVLAFVFMITSFSLALMSSSGRNTGAPANIAPQGNVTEMPIAPVQDSTVNANSALPLSQ